MSDLLLCIAWLVTVVMLRVIGAFGNGASDAEREEDRDG